MSDDEDINTFREKNAIFVQMDQKLGIYYQKQGKKDYYDDDGNGIFLNWCHENGMDQDDIDEEFESFENCGYLDFDEDIPLDADTREGDDEEAIFAILSGIYADLGNNDDQEKEANDDNKLMEPIEYKSEQRPIVKFKEFRNTDLVVSSKEKMKTKDICSQQIPHLYTTGFNTEDLVTVMSIGRKNNICLLQYLADCYSRDMLKVLQKKHTFLTTDEWSTQNAFIKLVSKREPKMAITMKSSVSSFYRRTCQIIESSPMVVIQDKLDDICSYIDQICLFLRKLVYRNSSCPFQADFCFLFDKTKSTAQSATMASLIGDDSDEESSDDSGNETDDEPDDDDDDLDNGGCFGDISKNIAKHKLCSHSIKTNVRARVISDNFENFELKQKKHKNYPQRKRFVCVIDRRLKSEKDEITFFEPPNQAIPNNHISQWYLDSTRTCVIPSIAYNGKPDKDTIHSGQTNGGKSIILSFHVDSIDKICCYFYWNGRMIRVHSLYFGAVLCNLFDSDFANNKKFVETNATSLMKNIDFVWDSGFEGFYDYCQNV